MEQPTLRLEEIHDEEPCEFVVIDQHTQVQKISPNLSQRLFKSRRGVGRFLSDICPIHSMLRKKTPFIFYFAQGDSCRVDVCELATNYILLFQFQTTALQLKRHAVLFEQISNCIMACDETGTIFLYNQAYGRLEGHDPQEVLGKKLDDIYQMKPDESLLLQVMADQKPIYAQHQQYHMKNGRMIDCVADVYPLVYNGKVIGAAENVHDLQYAKLWAQQIIQIETDLYSRKKNTSHLPVFDMKYQSSGMQQCIAQARLTLESDGNICIHGSEGTETQDIAHAVIQHGCRAGRPYVEADFSTIPPHLIAPLLFGQQQDGVRGTAARPGLLQTTDTGTLLLKHIGYIPRDVQHQLLHFIQTGTYFPTGGVVQQTGNVRFITLLSQGMDAMRTEGKVLLPLLYALNTVYLYVPDLPKRMEDLPLLAKEAIVQINQLRPRMTRLSGAALRVLMSYPWTGHYAELYSVLENASSVCPPKQEIGPQHLPQYILPLEDSQPKELLHNTHEYTLSQALEYTEHAIIRDALARAEGNITKAAEYLGIQRQNLQYRKKKLGL